VGRFFRYAESSAERRIRRATCIALNGIDYNTALNMMEYEASVMIDEINIINEEAKSK